MRSWNQAGWRSTILAVAITSLLLLPYTATPAERPQAMANGGVSGLQATTPDDDSARRPALYQRGTYVWPYATGPSYGSVAADRGRAPGVLHTAVGWFDLGQGRINLPTELMTTNKLGQMPAQYFIVQVDPTSGTTGVRADLEGILAAEGGAIMRSMPVGAVLARLTAGAHSRIQGLPGLIAVEPYHPGFKLDSRIGRSPLPDPIKAQSQVYSLRVHLFAGEPVEPVADMLAKMGGNITSVFPDEVRVEIDRAQLAAIASLEPVYMIWEDLPQMTQAEETTTCMQTGRYNQGAIPYHDAGIKGDGGGLASGQVLMILDSGIQMDAAELSHTRTAAGDGVGDPWGSTHRKVELYATCSAFSGGGDLLGCDGQQDAMTHGHFVAATALGNATDVDPSYGLGWVATNPTVPGETWKLDGVAPGARLVAYDASTTPSAGPCADPETGEALWVGDLYTSPSAGSLGQAYATYGARTINFSWGANNNSYDGNALDVDDFLDDHRDAMVFTSAGNSGQDADPNDGIPDEGSLGAPATFKNGLAIGSSRNADDPNAGPNGRAANSSVGPVETSWRIAPQLMAPGDEANGGSLGLSSEFACTTGDNDQTGTVSCNVLTGLEGTSFASSAAAGAALLVRDYFAQGFYPDGTVANPGNSGDQHATISGSLLKSVLIASAEFMTGDNTHRPWRFNVEQGYGRIELDNALPLGTWAASPTGLIVVDGEYGFGDLSGLDGSIDMTVGGTDSANFEVCDDEQQLRIALSWLEESGNDLVNDLNLEIEAPSGKIYYGNYFTDDDNRDYTTDSNTEDCPSIDGDSDSLEDWGPWSLPTCVRADLTVSPHDDSNPTEAVHLSMDTNDDNESDLDPDDDNQIEIGTWKIRVIGVANALGDPDQRYSVALAGGVCIGSSVRLDAGSYVCNSRAKITVNEFDEPGDPGSGLSVGEVAGRLTVQVIDGTDSIVDYESGSDLDITQPDLTAYRYVAEDVIMTDGTAYDPGNGVLDVRSGDRVRVVYEDEISGVHDADKRRVTTADVDCDVRVGFGDIVFGQYGMDEAYLVDGGCDRNARGNFEFGYPDRYMDAEELISFKFAFASEENFDLEQAEVSLSCVIADTNSPEDCRPNSTDCADPNRLDNTTCDGSEGGDPVYMTILDTPKTVGLIRAGWAISTNFSILMASSIPGTPEIEMLLELTSATSGKTSSGLGVSRHILDADEVSVFFSTDWPTGGTTYRDRNNDEVIVGFLGEYPAPGDVSSFEPTTNYGDWLADYLFECVNWGDLTAGGTKNTTLQSPWHFDVTNGGFTTGVGADTDLDTITDVIAQWGEDKNFNGLNDGYCQADDTVWCEGTDDCEDALLTPNTCISLEDRDADNGELDQNWSTQGGCGWQTVAPYRCSNNPRRGCYTNDDCISPGICTGAYIGKGGIWHTGTVGNTTSTDCLVLGADTGQCQAYETISGTTGQKMWFELLVTPEISKVNGDNYKLEIMDWGWNQAIDLTDGNAYWTWEIDTDTEAIEPVDLIADTQILNYGNGGYGSVINESNPDLTNGFSVFAPVAGFCQQSTGTPCADNTDCPLTCWTGGAGCEEASDCLGSFCVDSPHSPCGTDTQCENWGQGLYCIENYCDACSNIYDITGSLGNNRQGQNSCFFQGVNGIKPTAIPLLGFAEPADDDLDNDSDGTVDEYVTFNGPMRNMDIFAFNGPDMRFDTLEDIYGESGNKFQAAVGMLNFEKPSQSDADPAAGFGIAVDDMVIEWREFYLADDNSTCGATGGECAVIDMQTNRFFEGNTRLEISVLEKSPPWLQSPPTTNDCDFDEVVDGTNDCDSDGTNDLPIRATSEVETTGEIVFANYVSGYLFRAELPVSALYDVEGVLFVQPAGVDNPTVCAVYFDNDDGTGQVCQNDADPSIQGRLEVCSTLFFTRGDFSVIGNILTDNNDHDGWADSYETIDMELLLANKTGIDISGLTARLVSNDPKIECIINPVMELGDWEADLTQYTGQTFTFRVGDADRTTAVLGPTDDFSAELSIILSANEFDAAYIPQKVLLNLDLDGLGGGGPMKYTETFGSANFGSFTTMNMDAGRNSETASEGWRCQYSDPDWIYSNSYGQIDDCWLAASPTQAAAYFWQMDSTVAGPDARAYDDGHSVYMGIYDVANSWWTTPLATMEAFGTNEPINLGFANVCETTRTVPCDADSDCPGGETCVGVSAELSFKHQASFVDWKSVNADPMTSADVGMVALQLADSDSDGTPIGNWIRLEAFYNAYDQQRCDGWTNCQFDPTDDGTTEDDFFDMEDPFRRTGPSSTCYPLFNFTYMGDTDADYAPGNVNNAEPDSGLAGLTGTGTWVESKFNLAAWRGNRVRLRFLTTALKAGTSETYESLFGWNAEGNNPGDDGWWIDDIQVKDALASFATIINDDQDNSGLPGCGSSCDTVTADLVADPAGALGAPGQVVELSALDSVANRCVDGTLQYQFWIQGSPNSLLRGWTDNPVIVQAPIGTTTYIVDVRCSADITCNASTSVSVDVDCPWSGIHSKEVWGERISAYAGYCLNDPEEQCCTSDGDCPGAGICVIPTYPNDGIIFLSWASKASRRKSSTVRLDDGGKANGYYINRFYPAQDMTCFRDVDVPPYGEWYWYLIRPIGEYCNQLGSWQNAWYCSEDGSTSCVSDDDCSGTCSVQTDPGRDQELP